MYDQLFKMPSFLRVVREVIDEYFEKPVRLSLLLTFLPFPFLSRNFYAFQGVAERYKPACSCPVNNGCECPEPVTTAQPQFNVSSSSQHILGALKDMSNGVSVFSIFGHLIWSCLHV